MYEDIRNMWYELLGEALGDTGECKFTMDTVQESFLETLDHMLEGEGFQRTERAKWEATGNVPMSVELLGDEHSFTGRVIINKVNISTSEGVQEAEIRLPDGALDESQYKNILDGLKDFISRETMRELRRFGEGIEGSSDVSLNEESMKDMGYNYVVVSPGSDVVTYVADQESANVIRENDQAGGLGSDVVHIDNYMQGMMDDVVDENAALISLFGRAEPQSASSRRWGNTSRAEKVGIPVDKALNPEGSAGYPGSQFATQEMSPTSPQDGLSREYGNMGSVQKVGLRKSAKQISGGRSGYPKTSPLGRRKTPPQSKDAQRFGNDGEKLDDHRMGSAKSPKAKSDGSSGYPGTIGLGRRKTPPQSGRSKTFVGQPNKNDFYRMKDRSVGSRENYSTMMPYPMTIRLGQ